MSITRRLRQALYVGLTTCTLACAQEVTTSMTYDWDQPSGDIYVHAESTLDYDSSYYYFVCVGIDLFQTPGSYSGTENTCDYTDAVVDWYTTVSTDPITLDIESENYVWMNYYADQFAEGWPDGDCWDAYQANYFNGFIDESGGTDYTLPGLPSVGVGDQYFTYYEFTEDSSCACGTLSPTSGTTNLSSCPVGTAQPLASVSGNFQQYANSSNCVLLSSSTCLLNTDSRGIFGTGGGSAVSSGCAVNFSGSYIIQNVQFTITASSGTGHIEPYFTLVMAPKTGSSVTKSCPYSDQTINCP